MGTGQLKDQSSDEDDDELIDSLNFHWETFKKELSKI